jgi:hypothetical protein
MEADRVSRKLLRLPDASHWVHHDDPERVNQLISDFFRPRYRPPARAGGDQSRGPPGMMAIILEPIPHAVPGGFALIMRAPSPVA